MLLLVGMQKQPSKDIKSPKKGFILIPKTSSQTIPKSIDHKKLGTHKVITKVITKPILQNTQTPAKSFILKQPEMDFYF